MNKIIPFQDIRNFDFQNLWELKNPKFSQAPNGSREGLIQFKRRHSGTTIGALTNYVTPSRLYGVRKLLAWCLWVFILVLIAGTILAYGTGSGETGQIYFALFFVGAYLLLFAQAAKSRLRRWEVIYTKAIKTDIGTHTKPAVIFDGQDMLLGNARLFEMLGDQPIAAFVADCDGQLKHKDRQEMEAKRAAEKEKARIKKEKEDKEFKEAIAVVGPLIGGGLKELVREGGVSSRAAQSARGTLQTDSLSSRAAKAARGTPSRPAEKPNTTPPAEAGSIKIEGYTGSYWETCATGLDNNANYIASRMQQIRKSNPRYTKLRAVDGKGRVIDVG